MPLACATGPMAKRTDSPERHINCWVIASLGISSPALLAGRPGRREQESNRMCGPTTQIPQVPSTKASSSGQCQAVSMGVEDRELSIAQWLRASQVGQQIRNLLIGHRIQHPLRHQRRRLL